MDSQIKKFLQSNKLEVLIPFDVMWSGWEGDNTWFLCRKKSGEIVVVATSHGSPYITNREGLDLKIKEYEKLVKKTKAILELIS